MQAPFRILILEDDEILRMSMVGVLEEEGYQVSAVGRGLDAVEQAQSQDFDLIVTDIRMAGMDGLDALAQVKENRPAICSMVVTGYSTEADSVRAIQLGVQEYLRKPFRLDQFLEGVQRLTGRRRLEQAQFSRERALSRTAIWALEAVLRQLSPQQQAGEPVGLGRLAQRTAQALGLSAEQAEGAQLVTLAGLLRRFPGPSDPAGLYQVLPQPLLSLLEQAWERWDGQTAPEGLAADQIPLAARIAAPLLHFPDTPGPALLEKAPGAFDPGVVEELTRMTGAAAAPPSTTVEAAAASRRRSLLSLGAMCEEAGDVTAASRAFQSVIQLGGVHREAVEASLGLARLAHGLGDSARCLEFCQKASTLARQLSPVTWASTVLHCLHRVDESARGRLAGELEPVVAALKLPNLTALWQLSRAFLGEPVELAEPLALLGRPEYQPDLFGAVPWLLRLLAMREDPSFNRWIVRLTRERPREAERLLTGSLTGGPRRYLLQALVENEDTAAWLKRFGQDAEVAAVLASRPAAGGPGAELPTLRLLSLGPLEIYRGRERVPEKAWKSSKNRLFLACIASQLGRPISEDLLMEEFWPNDPATAKANLYSTLSNLRKVLRPSDWPGADLEYVVRTQGGYQMNPDLPRWHDLEEFSRAVQQCEASESAGQVEAALAQARLAANLFRGPYLEGCYMEWAQPHRQRVERQITEVLRKLSARLQGLGRHAEALEYAHRLLEVDCCCQEGYQIAMGCNLGLGRPEESIRLYELCCKTLRRELAMEPSIAILEAYQRARLSLP